MLNSKRQLQAAAKGNNMYRFAILGTAGYIAPKHLEAIRQVGGRVVIACDPHDSVGILDRYDLNTSFYDDYDEFANQLLSSAKLEGNSKVDYLVICSPNFLHYKHCELGLKSGCHVICEKPLAMNSQDLTDFVKLQGTYPNHKINTILQLRLHPNLINVRNQLLEGNRSVHKVNLTYITARGQWYQKSWKGNEDLSGGIAVNIGIHLFDLLTWLFGAEVKTEIYLRTRTSIAGYFLMQNAEVHWYLSIDAEDLDTIGTATTVFRMLEIDNKKVDFFSNTDGLHIAAYEQILKDAGNSVHDVEPSISLVDKVRRTSVMRPTADRGHPILAKKRIYD